MKLRVALMVGMAWIAATVAAGCRHHSPEVQPVFETGPVHWGEPVNGLQAGLAIKRQVSGPENLAWRPVYIEFCLRNVGQYPIRIIEPLVPHDRSSAAGGRPMVDARLTTPAGEVYRIGLLPPPQSSSRTRSIAPGEVYSIKGQFGGDLLIAPGYWGLSAPLEGECALSFHNLSPTSELRIDRNETVTVYNLWTGHVESAPMKIRFAGPSEVLASEP